MHRFESDEREWLEADGLGGFASGTVSGVRTRRYHALLLAATTPPTGRIALVQGFDAWLETSAGRSAISSQRYAPGVVSPDGHTRIESFTAEPWPSWTFRLDDGTRLAQEILVPHGRPMAIVRWRRLAGADRGTLVVRPFVSGRDYHSLHHENAILRATARVTDGVVEWQPYTGVPSIVSRTNGRYHHDADWYRRFLYSVERERGLDDTEDLFAPGWLEWDLAQGEAVWCVGAGAEPLSDVGDDVGAWVARTCARERVRRISLGGPLHRAADAYLVRRGTGQTIIAGYPWFTDWGRDTFIAIRGLCLATGRVDAAREILLEWSDHVSEGMLPNRFPDAGGTPEFNAADASLWFVAAVQAFEACVASGDSRLTPDERVRLDRAVDQILAGYAGGTRYGIRMDADGLIACGVPGVQVTWMDAKIGDRVVTPRVGKPVEIQALWLNALGHAAGRMPRWTATLERARRSFERRFWNAEGGCLFDVVDVDHQPGAVDKRFRPNQIFAVGGLPVVLLDAARARQLVDAVEARLLTPMGLRSLAPGEPGYRPRCEDGPAERDEAYHQGTVWPWLMGAFVDAWLAVRPDQPDVRREARDRFLAPLRAHLDEAGIGHVSEIADADPPHRPRGCPFQAWSVAELIRIEARLGTL